MQGAWSRLVGALRLRPPSSGGVRPVAATTAGGSDHAARLIDAGLAFQRRQEALLAAAAWDELGIGLDVSKALHPSSFELPSTARGAGLADHPAGSGLAGRASRCQLQGGRRARVRRPCRRTAPR